MLQYDTLRRSWSGNELCCLKQFSYQRHNTSIGRKLKQQLMPVLVQKIQVATNASFGPSIFFSPVSSIFLVSFTGFGKIRICHPILGQCLYNFISMETSGKRRFLDVSRRYKKETLRRIRSTAVCYDYVTYAFHSKSALYSCLNIK